MRVRFAGFLLLTLAVLPPLPARSHRAARRAAPEVTFDPNVINDPGQAQPVSPGDKGSAVLRAQVLLDRQHFSCGELDGVFGDNLQKTVTAFQKNRNLPPSGSVDPQTWAVLNADTAPVLTTYTITAQDEAGPFIRIPAGMMDQAALKTLGYESPLEELGERFHVSPKVLAALNRGKDFTKTGEQILAPNVITMPPGQAAAIVVSKGDSSLTAWDTSGKFLAYYIATIGSDHDPLPMGTWEIQGVRRYPVFHYNAKLFWDADNPDEKAVIQAGPNNPVGVVWIDISKEHYGIHGTPNPSKIGHGLSHGCIRLTNWDAWELGEMVKPGTPALLQE